MQRTNKSTKPAPKRLKTKQLTTVALKAKLNDDATALAQLIYDLYKDQRSM